MKILHLSNVVGRSGGGVSEVVQNLASRQNESGVYAELWFPGNLELSKEVNSDAKIPLELLKPLATFGNPSYGICKDLFSYRDHVINGFDIIHQHGIWLPTSRFTHSFNGQKKTIISPHGYLEKERLQMSSFKKKIAYKLFEKNNLESADCLVACSDQEAEGLRDFGLNNPIAVIPNGINDHFVNYNPSELSRNIFLNAHNNLHGKKILLFLSRIHELKGLPLLLKALKKNQKEFEEKNWVLVIAGIDENNHTSHLKGIVNSLNLDSIVNFIGPVFGDDKINLMDLSKCFILPSINENFGIVVAEAMARRLPVITTKRTPWQDLESYNCGWWINRDEEVISNTINELIATPEHILKLKGDNGRQLIKNKYMWESISNKFIELYKRILSSDYT